jgi:hypothetical protein
MQYKKIKLWLTICKHSKVREWTVNVELLPRLY